MFCAKCGNKIDLSDAFCSSCGNPINNSQNSSDEKANQQAQQKVEIKKQNEKIVVPSEVKRWNWGAFVFTWIWGLSNKVYISLLMFLGVIPVIGSVFAFIFAIILGANGNAMAYKNQSAKSADDFLRSQKGWNTVALFFFFIPLALATLVLIIGLIMVGKGLIDFSIFIEKVLNFLRIFIPF